MTELDHSDLEKLGLITGRAMDAQDVLNNAMAAMRAKTMQTSKQLVIAELLLKLEAIEDKERPVVYDVAPWFPTHAGSWRGSYDELALDWTNEGDAPMVTEVIKLLRGCIGWTFTGYKGGDFTMGKLTPVWVANYGECEAFGQGDSYAIVGVRQDAAHVVLVTEPMEWGE